MSAFLVTLEKPKASSASLSSLGIPARMMPGTGQTPSKAEQKEIEKLMIPSKSKET